MMLSRSVSRACSSISSSASSASRSALMRSSAERSSAAIAQRWQPICRQPPHGASTTCAQRHSLNEHVV